MYNMMKKQNFGVEIELTGITRQHAAKVIANYYGTRSEYAGTYYKTYTATDSKGRTWKAMSDASIRTERKSEGRTVSAGDSYSCEVVTPIQTAPAESTSTLTAPTTPRRASPAL